MNLVDLHALLPLLVLAVTAITVMLAAAFRASHAAAAGLTLGGLVTALASLAMVQVPHRIGALLLIDSFAVFFIAFIVATAGVVVILSYDYLAKFHLRAQEYYILLLLATLGACVLAASQHLVALFLGLELLSVSLYVMIAYVFRREHSLEAAVKYLILAAASSAFLVFGMALVYAQLGALTFGALADAVRDGAPSAGGIWLAGIALMTTGFGFKLAWAPFHLWTPDVYQGAPAPVTAFIATVSKGAMLALLLRVFEHGAGAVSSGLFNALASVAVASMTLGNLLALRQDNLKRLLAYSSIAHLGYLLVAFLAGGTAAGAAIAFYLVSYALATLSAFGLIGALASADAEPEALTHFRGLFWQRPWQALALTLALLSLIGLPLTGGFWGKFLVISAGVHAGLWTLVILLALNSALGLFYYLRVLLALYAAPANATAPAPAVSAPVAAVLVILGTLTLVLGLFPAPLLDLIRALGGIHD